MKDCDKCNQTIQNCECHISDQEKNAGIFELINDLEQWDM